MDVEPDFEGEEWSVTRDAFVGQGDSPEEAITKLQTAWRDQHQRNLERWEEHRQQEQQDRDDEQAGQNGQEATPAVDPGPEAEKPDWLNYPTPNFLDIRPARHVLKRLEKKEFVELWHFTVQGCQDAARSDLSAPDDTFNLVNTGNGLMLQSVGAAAVSSKVVKDELLSFEQWIDGKDRLISCMEALNWDKHEVQELVLFFFRLGKHRLRSERQGLQAILRYQEMVRRDWTSARRNGGKAYAISVISDDLLHDYHRKILNEIQDQNVSGFIQTNKPES